MRISDWSSDVCSSDLGLSTEWDGEPFAADQLACGEPVRLMAHEVAWGRLEALEAFCVTHGLPFARWSGAYAEIGRASCRDRVCQYVEISVVAGSLKKKSKMLVDSC